VNAPPAPRGPRSWLRATALTLGFGVLVAGGLADQGALLPLLLIAVAGLAIGFFHLLFPQGMHFGFGASAGLAVYACFLW
jgi:hypothetical protein